jgi:hypothetical protein
MSVGKKRGRRGRKLLVASLGVAAVSYVACGGNSETSGNLVPPPDAGKDSPSNFDAVGNLVGPLDSQADVAPDVPEESSVLDVVANLVAPIDATDDVADAGTD